MTQYEKKINVNLLEMKVKGDGTKFFMEERKKAKLNPISIEMLWKNEKP